LSEFADKSKSTQEFNSATAKTMCQNRMNLPSLKASMGYDVYELYLSVSQKTGIWQGKESEETKKEAGDLNIFVNLNFFTGMPLRKHSFIK